MIHHVGFRDVAPAFADGDHQLDLVVQIFCLGRIGDGARRIQRRIGGFGEKERRLTRRIFAHLAGVRLVVATHAEDAAHGKTGVGALHSQTGLRRGGEYKIISGHGAYPLQ